VTTQTTSKSCALVIGVPIIVSLSGCNAESVDSGPPVKVATDFYGHLRAPDVKTALTLFSPEFTKTVSIWPEALNSIQSKFGPVVSAELQNATLASNGHAPCYLLTYKVKRESLESHERLFVCRSDSKSEWTIDGQQLNRDDTGSNIVGGKIPNVMGINSP
jgi:hypothetical protein